MICPGCKGEFRPGSDTCPDCGCPLVEAASVADESSPASREDSVVVLRTSDAAILALARSLLEDADITYAVNNERMVGLYPSAFGAPTLDAKHRAAEIEVLDSNAGRARELLAGLGEGAESGES